MIRYRLLSPATREVAIATEIYAAINVELGLAFIDEFDHAVELICKFPEAWMPLDELNRRYLMKRFPYGIIYRPHDGIINIVAVLHLHSDPESWEKFIHSR